MFPASPFAFLNLFQGPKSIKHMTREKSAEFNVSLFQPAEAPPDTSGTPDSHLGRCGRKMWTPMEDMDTHRKYGPMEDMDTHGRYGHP